MGFSRQEYWSGQPFPTLGDSPDPKIKPTSPSFTGRCFTNSTTWEAQLPTQQALKFSRCGQLALLRRLLNNQLLSSDFSVLQANLFFFLHIQDHCHAQFIQRMRKRSQAVCAGMPHRVISCSPDRAGLSARCKRLGSFPRPAQTARGGLPRSPWLCSACPGVFFPDSL